MKLYVGNLSYETTEEDLRTIFGNHGEVESVSLIKDRDTGRSKGFAFVEMGNSEEATEAMSGLNGTDLHERRIKVDEARPPENRSRGGRSGGRDRC